MTAISSFITSQGDTAPKRAHTHGCRKSRFITSQGDTAPKRYLWGCKGYGSFITSQGDTAPKLIGKRDVGKTVSLPVRVTLLQNSDIERNNKFPFHYQSG